MAKVDVLDWNKKKKGEVELDSQVFEQEVRKDLIQAVVKWQLACRRQGTHSTKTREFVRGGGRKPFRQKGTGNARQGTSRSPLMPGGAIVFGPQPRDYSYTLPKKTKKAALRSALSHAFKEGKFLVVDEIKSEGKTKEMAQRLEKFGTSKALVVDEASDAMVLRATRNLKNYKYMPVAGVNVFDLLKYDTVIASQSSIDGLTKRCLNEGAKNA